MMPFPPSKILCAFVADQPKVKQGKAFRIAISGISMSRLCANRNTRLGFCFLVISLIAHAGDGAFSFSGTCLDEEKKLSQKRRIRFPTPFIFTHT